MSARRTAGDRREGREYDQGFERSDSRGAGPGPDEVRGKPDTSGFGGFVRGFGYALAGIASTFGSELNMRVHAVFTVAALVACAVLRCTPMEWCIVITFIVLVLAAELVNTAVEAAVDLETRGRHHPLAKKAKDAAAGAVLVLAIGAAVAGLIVYINAFARLMG